MSKLLFVGSASVEVVVVGARSVLKLRFLKRQFVSKLLFWEPVGVKAMGG